jgi:Na+-translocating ferredoxin:NAD+ oxidoreductase RnfC subunit
MVYKPAPVTHGNFILAPQVAAPQRAGTHAPTSGTVVAVHPNRSTAHVDVGHVAATKRLFGIYP